MKQLRSLDLGGAKVTEEGIKALAGKKLRDLIIPHKARTNVGLKHYLAAIEPRLKLELPSFSSAMPG